jgi:6-pyruvoyltetrahydropterin/6-carboxytetrahydropterin synthase
MLTCKKVYKDIPFAHRQHTHDGHCSFVHGHNWGIEIVFGCRELDSNGFVMDFGKLRCLRDWIDENLDHAILLNRLDPERENILNSCVSAFKSYLIDNCSSEGLASHLYDVFSDLISKETLNRVFIVEITVFEDSKNSATYRP